MYYEKPEVQKMGRADELVEVIYFGPDFEPSTQMMGYVDPAFGLDSDATSNL